MRFMNGKEHFSGAQGYNIEERLPRTAHPVSAPGLHATVHHVSRRGDGPVNAALNVVPVAQQRDAACSADYRIFVADGLVPPGAALAGFIPSGQAADADILVVPAATAGGTAGRRGRRLRPVIRIGRAGEPVEFQVPDLRADRLRPVLDRAVAVVDRLRELRLAVDDAMLADPAAVLLAFAWSRGGRIAARLSARFERGFGYDAAGVLAAAGDAAEPDPVPHLMALAEAGYLTPEFRELAHTCPDCGSINVLLRDGCPECGGVDVADETLIHHFACGFQGEEQRFATHAGAYVCPKCRKELRHFGLDYDKPGLVHLCKGCGHRATELEARGRCLACEAGFSGEDSPRLAIHDFVLTPEGTDALFSGTVSVDPIADLIGRSLPLVPLDFAAMMAKKMAAIEARHGLSTLVVTIDLSRIVSLPRGTGMQAAFFVRIGTELSILLRATDVAACHLGRIVLVLPGADTDRADQVRARLCGALRSVFDRSVVDELGFEHCTVDAFLRRRRHGDA